MAFVKRAERTPADAFAPRATSAARHISTLREDRGTWAGDKSRNFDESANDGRRQLNVQSERLIKTWQNAGRRWKRFHRDTLHTIYAAHRDLCASERRLLRRACARCLVITKLAFGFRQLCPRGGAQRRVRVTLEQLPIKMRRKRVITAPLRG